MDALIADQKPEISWSYSKLHGYELCPRRHYETEILKDKWPKEKSELLAWGDAVHVALAHALRTGEPLDELFQLYQPWVDKVVRTPGKMLIEDDCRWAITREFKPTAWFAKNVWLRCVADVVKLDYPVALVVDWKAGKSSNVDPIQLTLTSLMLLIQFPKVECVRSDFVWLQENHQTTQILYRNEAADRWAEIIPRVKRFEEAVATENFPPIPGRFCKRYCPVRSCEYFGK
jgi:PD-(D/E)XK nuclease superfamily protein